MFKATTILHTALNSVLISAALTAAACGNGMAGDAGTDAPDQLIEGEHQKLARLLGDWKGTGTLKMGDNLAPVTSAFSCQVAPGGAAVACTHHAEIEGMGPMIENALIGVDPASGKLHWYNVNTMGETHDHVGHWASADQIAWSFEGEAEGQPLVESITMDLGGGELSFRSETTVGGQQAALFEGTMTR